MSNVKTKATYPQGGTGVDSLGTANQVLATNAGATAAEWQDASSETEIYGFTVSDNLKYSADAEAWATNNEVLRYKQITIRRSGTIRVKFDIRNTAGSTKFQVFKNGVGASSEATCTTNYVTHTRDMAVLAYDTIALYMSSNYTAGTKYGKNFRIYYDVATAAEGTVDYNPSGAV